MMIVVQQPVLTPYHKRFYCAFGTVVVDIQSAVFDITTELFPLIEDAINGFTKGALL